MFTFSPENISTVSFKEGNQTFRERSTRRSPFLQQLSSVKLIRMHFLFGNRAVVCAFSLYTLAICVECHRLPVCLHVCVCLMG